MKLHSFLCIIPVSCFFMTGCMPISPFSSNTQSVSVPSTKKPFPLEVCLRQKLPPAGFRIGERKGDDAVPFYYVYPYQAKNSDENVIAELLLTNADNGAKWQQGKTFTNVQLLAKDNKVLQPLRSLIQSCNDNWDW